MSMKLKPLGNRVVVEPIEQDEVTAGVSFFPENSQKEKPQKRKPVLSVGPGKG